MNRRIRALMSALVATAMLVLSVPLAQAASPTYRVGQIEMAGSVFNTSGSKVPTALIPLRDASGQVGMTYCIDINTPVSSGQTGYKETLWSESGIANLGKVQWILNNSYPNKSVASVASAAGVVGLTRSQATMATQTAIWYLTDGFNLRQTNAVDDGLYNSTTDKNVVALYNWLLNNATVTPEPELQHVTIDVPSGVGVAGERVGPITVTSNLPTLKLTASPSTIQFVYGDGSPVNLAAVASGSKIYVVAPASAGSVALSATATITIEAGRAFKHAGTQTLILATSFDRTDSSSATVSWKVQPTKPDPIVSTTTETQKDCVKGVEERTATTTVDWQWNADKWEWVKKAPVVTYSDWAKVRDLTPAEKAELRCEQPTKPDPRPTPKPALPKTGGDGGSSLPLPALLVAAGAAAVWAVKNKKS